MSLRLSIGDRVRLFGGYDPDPPWLAGESEYMGTVREFVPSDGIDEAVVELDEAVVVEGIPRPYALLRLRYEGAEWSATEHVHVVFCADPPSAGAAPWSGAAPGVWMESHAQYERAASV